MVTVPYRRFASTDQQELLGRIDAARDRFLEVVRMVDPELRPSGSAWTVRDITGHLLTVVRRYLRRPVSGGEGLAASPREVDRLNAAELAALGDASRDQLATDLVAEMDVLRQRYSAGPLDLEATAPFHGGVTIDMAAGMSNLIAELLIHGRDVARAAGRPWAIEERDAVLVLNGVMQILPAYARRTARQPLRARLDVAGAAPWMLDFADGRLASRPAQPGESADTVIRAPATALLLLLYSRLSVAAAVRAGMLVVGGRRPWRAVRLSRVLEKP